MKITFAPLIVVLISASAYTQELASKGGLTISYEASKTESTKKADKWSIKIIVNNTTGADLYFSAMLSSNAVSLDAPYVRIDIPNAKGLLATNLDYLRAPMVDGVLTSNKRPVFKIPAGTLTKDLTTTVAIGETPAVKGTIMIDPKSLADVTSPAGSGTSASPTAAAPSSASPAPAPVGDQTEILVIHRASLMAGQKLMLRQSLEMPAYPEIRLILDGSGNLSLYNDGGKTPLWSSDTAGKQVSYGEMQADGNFVLKTAADEAVWATETAGNPGSMVVLGQGGTLAIFTKEMQIAWQVPGN
jgi:hypothetical protein